MAVATTSGRAFTPLAVELLPAVSAWDVARRLADLPHLLFLDSAMTGGELGRYSFVTADPFAWRESRNGAADPIRDLESALAGLRLDLLPGLSTRRMRSI